jgi:hypothetical protein
MVSPELLAENVVGILPGTVMSGTKRNRFPIRTAKPETSWPNVSGFGKRSSANGAGKAPNKFQVLRVFEPPIAA